MSSTRKNNKWYFGAKGHIGVQSEGYPLVHNTAFSTAKAADKTHMTRLLHGAEKAIFGDSAYGAQADKRGARHEGIYYGIADRGAYQHPLSSSQKKRNRKHSSQGRAYVSYHQRIVGSSKIALQRAGKKWEPIYGLVCVVQFIFLPKRALFCRIITPKNQERFF